MQTLPLEQLHFPVVREDGTVAECEVLLAFSSPKNGKHYLVYTDNSVDETGALTLFASAYRKSSMKPGAGPLSEVDLLPIESKAEWALIEAAIEAASAA